MTDEKVTPLRKGPIDDHAAELAEGLKTLIKRVESGHIVGIFGVIVTDDPEDEDAEDGIELLQAGCAYTEERVIVGLQMLAEDLKEDLREAMDANH